jgi:NADH:ubiquinone oxidoreductase subunit 4 (subunit M)
MVETDLIWMSLVIFIPSVFALGLLFFPRDWKESMRWWSLFGTALTLGVSIAVFIYFKAEVVDPNVGSGRDEHVADARQSLLARSADADRQGEDAPANSKDWITRSEWVKGFNIDYFLGVDGISLALVLLTTFLCFLAMIASWKIDKFVRGYCILFLVLETGLLGTFLALDFFLFYVFWEVMLLPMYFLIGVWGGPRREYAALKFFLYTLLGSVLILIALLAFYFTNVRDFVPTWRLEKVAGQALNRKDFDDSKIEVDRYRRLAAQADQALKEPREAYEQSVKDLQKAIADHKDEIANRQAVVDRTREPFLEAQRKADEAEVEFDRAQLAYERELALLPVTYNTFDLVLLQRVGKAALQHLHGTFPTRVPALEAAKQRRLETRKKAADLDTRVETVSAQTHARAAENVQAADKNLVLAQSRFQERLANESFFQPWFQLTMFVLLFIGFAIKVPIVPFHTWLPDAHVEAPTAISMLLAGVLLKMGGYGLLRIAYPICPWAAEQLAWWVALLGIINIVYGAFAAMAQTDFKRLVAYSSISHMGYVILGIAVWTSASQAQYWAWGMNGAVFQMVTHGLTSAGMFFLVGVLYDRAEHRNLNNFRGVYELMPLYGGFSAVIFFAAMGLPGLCGFVGEFMVVLSAWNFNKGFAILASGTVVLTAAYILWTLQRVFMGVNPSRKNWPDLTPREIVCLTALVIPILLLGLWPSLLLSWMEPSVTGLVDALVTLK